MNTVYALLLVYPPVGSWAYGSVSLTNSTRPGVVVSLYYLGTLGDSNYYESECCCLVI